MYGDNERSLANSVEVATLDNVLTSKGFNHITFNNLVFKGSNKNILDINNGSGISITNCEVRFSGENGIRGSKCKNLSINNSLVIDCYNDGINFLGSLSSSIKQNVIRNTFILAGMGGSGNVKGAGIRDGKAGIIENNHITYSGYIGIQMGGDSEMIKNNIIDSFCFLKDDGGGIYAVQGKQNIYYAGKIVGNIISNGIGAGDGTPKKSSSSAEGIYLDDNVYGIDIADNTVTSTNWGIYLHNAYDIVLTGNISYNNAVQLYAKHDKHHPVSNITMTDNNLIAQENDQTVMSLISSLDDIKDFGRFNNNFYTSANKKDMFNIQYKISGNLFRERPGLQELREKYGFEAATTNQLRENENIKDNAAFKIITNRSNKPKSFLLEHTYTDKNRAQYHKSISVPAYSSIILFKK